MAEQSNALVKRPFFGDAWTGAAALALLFMVVGGFEPLYLRAFLVDRAEMAKTFRAYSDQAFPGLTEFLLEVRRQTPAGARIAIVGPTPVGTDYLFVYQRAVYLLDDRVPVDGFGDQARVILSDPRSADYIAALRPVDPPGFEIVWRSARGVLLHRVAR